MGLVSVGLALGLLKFHNALGQVKSVSCLYLTFALHLLCVDWIGTINEFFNRTSGKRVSSLVKFIESFSKVSLGAHLLHSENPVAFINNVLK